MLGDPPLLQREVEATVATTEHTRRKEMFTARISDGKKSGKLFSGKQAVNIMKKAAIDAKKGKGAFRLELSENGRLCVVAFGKTAVEAASYGAAIHRKGVRKGGR